MLKNLESLSDLLDLSKFLKAIRWIYPKIPKKWKIITKLLSRWA